MTATFSNRTLVGNWNEEVELDNAKVQDFLLKKEKGALSINAYNEKMSRNTAKASLTYTEDGTLSFGCVVQLQCEESGNVAAVDGDDTNDSRGETYEATTSTDRSPVTRSSWVLQRFSKLDGFEGDKVHYGQRVRIVAHPVIGNNLYLSSHTSRLGALAKDTKGHDVEVVRTDNTDNAWSIWHANPKYRGELEGIEVKAGEPVIIKHTNTNQLLAEGVKKVRNDFGQEKLLIAKTQYDSHKLELPVNKWVLVTSDDPESRPDFTSTQRGVDGEEIERILGKMRDQVKRRGANGIRGLGRAFRIMDDNSNRALELSEFRKAMADYGVALNATEVEKLFDHYDQDSSGSINYEEFLIGLRGGLNEARKYWVDRAFDKLDANGNGVVELDDIAMKYNADKHPDVRAGRKSVEDVLSEFLDNFDSALGNPTSGDGTVTREEFEDYYGDLSASIDDDEYFALVMKNAWKLDD